MHRFVTGLARWLALLGGAVLMLLMGLTCLSVIGRTLNGVGHSDALAGLSSLAAFFQAFGPINGDYEIVEAGIAFAIFCFLPWCQLNRGHASVEVLTALFPQTTNRFLVLLWEALFAFVMVLIAWRLSVGMGDKLRYGETTFLLQFPVWWAYAICSVAAAIAALVALYSLWLRLSEMVSGKDFSPGEGGNVH